MSRSLHTTRSEYERRRRYSYADAEVRAEELESLREELRTKQKLKQVVRALRDDPLPESLAPVAPETIPVRVQAGAGPYGLLPSEGDLRAVLAALPLGTLDGLAEIVLCPGIEFQQEAVGADETEPTRDPWLNRVGNEILPGLWEPRVESVSVSESRIVLCVHVASLDLPDRAMWELVGRLWTLSGLVHEIASHEDRLRRTGNGRWGLVHETRHDDYANSRQAEWTRDCIVPHLERTYPEAVRRLGDWMAHHGGVRLPLDLLAGRWSWTSTGRLRRHGYGRAALTYLGSQVADGSPPLETRFEFGCDLIIGKHFAEARCVAAGILAEAPDASSGRTLEASILAGLGDPAGAISLAREILVSDPACSPAWQVLADACAALALWDLLLETSERGLASGEQAISHFRLVTWRCRALLELGRFEQMETALEDLTGGRLAARYQGELRALLLLRRGDFAEALTLVSRLCEQRRAGPLLNAVRFEASARVGETLTANELTPRMLASLRFLHHGAWVDRLVAEFGLVEYRDPAES